jgi:hypothetical protein
MLTDDPHRDSQLAESCVAPVGLGLVRLVRPHKKIQVLTNLGMI